MKADLNQPSMIRAWCMYDWANSVYSLVITSAIFPVYYQAITTNADGSDQVSFFGWQVANSVLYSYALSMLVPLLPLLSGIADYNGTKMRFMKIFVYIGSLSCIGLFFFTSANLEWGILCSVLASLGYAGSLVFYDAYLPEIVTEDRLDDVSARGYSFGYTGSVILMIVNIIMIEKWELFGFSSQGLATRFAFLTVGLWWIGFAQIPFRKLPQRVIPRAPGDRNLLNGFHELRKVWDSLAQLPDLKRFLFAYFFYNMGVQTVMYLAATFGAKELQLESSKLIATVLIIQLVAAVGAWIFSRVSHRKGNKFSLMVMIIIWIAICGMAYLTHNEYEFYGIAVLVGLVMGGIQALSRATYSKLIPRDTVDTASYFSFYDVLYNLCLAIGTFTYGLIEHLTGSMCNSTLALMVFFVLGLLLLWRVTIKHVPGAQPSSNA